MFENMLIPSGRKRGTIGLGYIVEGCLLALLVLVPLIHVQALPESLTRTIVPPPPAGEPRRPVAVRAVHRPSLSEVLAAPVLIPTSITPPRPSPEASSDAFTAAPPGAVPWGRGNGVPDGFGVNPLPPPPPAPARPPRTSRIVVGGVVEAARLVFKVQPEYPVIARTAHVQGTVHLEAIIGTDGSVQSLHVLSGPPLLVAAATRAVAEWRYQPTLLNGVAVEVTTEIDVTFTLSE